MTDRAQQAADAIDSVAALTPHQARSVLNEYTKDDLIAAIATGHGGRLQLKYEIVGIDYTDIVVGTGFADLYLLPEGETILVSWPVVSVGFDGVDSGAFPFSGVQAFGPGGAAGGAQLSDPADITSPSAAVDGLISGDPLSGGGNNTTTAMLPLVAPDPGGGAVQTVIDFTNGNVPCTQGTQGHLDWHLVIAVAP